MIWEISPENPNVGCYNGLWPQIVAAITTIVDGSMQAKSIVQLNWKFQWQKC